MRRHTNFDRAELHGKYPIALPMIIIIVNYNQCLRTWNQTVK